MPAVPSCYCLKRSAPYWSAPKVSSFDIRALWLSPEPQNVKNQNWWVIPVWQSVKP